MSDKEAAAKLQQEQIDKFEKTPAYDEKHWSERFCPVLSLSTVAGKKEESKLVSVAPKVDGGTDAPFLMGCQGTSCMFFSPAVGVLQHPVTKKEKLVITSGQCAITQLAVQTASAVQANTAILEIIARRARLKGVGGAEH